MALRYIASATLVSLQGIELTDSPTGSVTDDPQGGQPLFEIAGCRGRPNRAAWVASAYCDRAVALAHLLPRRQLPLPVSAGPVNCGPWSAFRKFGDTPRFVPLLAGEAQPQALTGVGASRGHFSGRGRHLSRLSARRTQLAR